MNRRQFSMVLAAPLLAAVVRPEEEDREVGPIGRAGYTAEAVEAMMQVVWEEGCQNSSAKFEHLMLGPAYRRLPSGVLRPVISCTYVPDKRSPYVIVTAVHPITKERFEHLVTHYGRLHSFACYWPETSRRVATGLDRFFVEGVVV